MLIIRREQLDAFQHASFQDCMRYVLAFARSEVPDEKLPVEPETLELRVRQGIRRALAYELEAYSDIATFVTFLFTAGPGFDRYPFFQSVLTDPDLEPDERMTTLVELATDLDWMRASAQAGELVTYSDA